MTHLPHSRSEWEKLEWKEAQSAVALLLKKNGFTIYEEKQIDRENRTDIMVIYSDSKTVVFGIVEVKCYDKISDSIVKKALKQACRYLDKWMSNLNPHRYGNKQKKYFAAAVFTRDYPASFSRLTPSERATLLHIDSSNIEVFACTPNSLLMNIYDRDIVQGKQSELDDFF